jgi:hypothetical protein
MNTHSSMKTNEQIPTPPCRCQCCGAPASTNAASDGRSHQVPAYSGHEVNWRDGLRPFLGFYVFKE